MYIGIDLGSTNLKAALYSGDMELIDRQSLPVSYLRENGFVEFDAEAYCRDLIKLIGNLAEQNAVSGPCRIAFTGQAESLVCVGKDGNALMNAISWMDERSVKQCAVLEKQFSPDVCQHITGQQAVLPTWPATKILWLKENRPEIFENTQTFMLLKDFVVYKLTGVKLADMSIATFSFYFDIYNKCYWEEMLNAIGISQDKLPPLAEPCALAGPLTATAAKEMGLSPETTVNIGTLDHFAGMIGTGNITPGGMTLSTGTVMAQAPVPRDSGIAMHYGFLPDTHIMLPVAESGGVSLEWFRRTCMGDVGYEEMNRVLLERSAPNTLLFLPYLVGTNAPEFDADAVGVFYGLRQEHDIFDMAHAVMEGVSFMLRKNCDHIRSQGTALSRIIATGGGAKSPVWCQLQSDITGLPVVVPKEKEAACLGAAMIAAVCDGKFADYEAAAAACVFMEKTYAPRQSEHLQRKYKQFNALYDAAVKIARL